MKMILSLKKRKRFVTVCIFTAVLTCVSGARVVFANDSSEKQSRYSTKNISDADKNVDITSKIEEKKKKLSIMRLQQGNLLTNQLRMTVP